MIYYIWLLGVFVTFIVLLSLKDSIQDLDRYIDSQFGESSNSNHAMFMSLLIVSICWPFIVVLLILDLFNANS